MAGLGNGLPHRKAIVVRDARSGRPLCGAGQWLTVVRSRRSRRLRTVYSGRVTVASPPGRALFGLKGSPVLPRVDHVIGTDRPEGRHTENTHAGHGHLDLTDDVLAISYHPQHLDRPAFGVLSIDRNDGGAAAEDLTRDRVLQPDVLVEHSPQPRPVPAINAGP